MKEILKQGSKNHTIISKHDTNNYEVRTTKTDEAIAHIPFQNGATQEADINGLFMEDLLYIVRDRLDGFNQGEWACKENSMAITKIEEALLWLNKRTAERKESGKYGTSSV